MRVAIPIEGQRLCAHFGHCTLFALLDVDEETQRVVASQTVTPPPHAPGVLPEWLKQQRVDVVIAGGMGSRAQALFTSAGVQVVTGAPEETAEALALAYVSGNLATGANACDH
jgi:predicted Fe-Mo cluster-binding NifX family protein